MISDERLRTFLPQNAVELFGDLIRWLLWAVVAVLWILLPRAYISMAQQATGRPWASDFSILYYTARLVADGLPMYGPSPNRYTCSCSCCHSCASHTARR